MTVMASANKLSWGWGGERKKVEKDSLHRGLTILTVHSQKGEMKIMFFCWDWFDRNCTTIFLSEECTVGVTYNKTRTIILQIEICKVSHSTEIRTTPNHSCSKQLRIYIFFKAMILLRFRSQGTVYVSNVVVAGKKH